MNKRNHRAEICFFFLICLGTFYIYGKDKKTIPEWVLNYQLSYPESEYIAQKGIGKKSDIAKNEAVANLSYYFETTVNARRESNYKSIQTSENQKNKNTTVQETIRDTSVTSSVTLQSVEFTEPYYNKKDKNWHCVAYIKRKNAWTKFEPELRVSKDNFMNYYKKANAETEVFYVIQNLNSALNNGWDFLDKYTYAQFLSEELTSQNYKEDMSVFSSLSSLIQSKKELCPLFIECSNDYGNQLYSCLSEILRNNGFIITKNKSNCLYYINGNVSFDAFNDDELFVYNPSIMISINKNFKSLYTYSYESGTVKAYTKKVAEQKSIDSICKILQNNFSDEFNATVSGNNIRR